MRRIALVALTLVLLTLVVVKVRATRGMGQIVNSKHDFRVQSTATIRSTKEQDPCVFCHTPHNSTPGSYLWNRKLPQANFPAYSSTTMQASVSQIQSQDVSKLCLSCHDGTIALGETLSDGMVEFVQGGGYTLPPNSPANLAGMHGFSDDHPFGFAPVQSAEVRNPLPGDAVHLDGRGKMQCTSCHEPHVEFADRTTGKFLVKSNQNSELCESCHQKAGWSNSAHRLPPNPIEDSKYTLLQGSHTGYSGVSKNGCESCHRPHSPAVGQRLIKAPEESTCFQCHNGTVATVDVRSDFYTKTYKHPVLTTPSSHDDSEGPTSARYTMPETSTGAPRHSECVDCHNPHYSQASPAGAVAHPPSVTPPLLGVRGQSAGNGYLPQSQNQYEICFKCHGDSANKPQALDTSNGGIGFGRNPRRQNDVGNPNAYNTRMEFTTSASFHPVTHPMNGSVPSLRPYVTEISGAAILSRPLNGGALIYCTDCHNSDTGKNAGSSGLGAAGPHGSNIPHILERQSALEPAPGIPGKPGAGVPYSVTNYSLCDKCHDVQNKLFVDRTFTHREHVQQDGAACSTCHDPHASNQQNLINFDLSIVAPNSGGQLNYLNKGSGHGTCNLACHGVDHKNSTY